jgi:hypothetical protein
MLFLENLAIKEHKNFIKDTILPHHSSDSCSSFFDMTVRCVSVSLAMEGGRGTWPFCWISDSGESRPLQARRGFARGWGLSARFRRGIFPGGLGCLPLGGLPRTGWLKIKDKQKLQNFILFWQIIKEKSYSWHEVWKVSAIEKYHFILLNMHYFNTSLLSSRKCDVH